MDEGFNTYSQARVLETAYPPPVLTRRYFEGFIPVVFSSVQIRQRAESADEFDGFRSALKLDAMSTLSWKYGPRAYGLNSYGKPAMMLRTLENYLGWETFQKAMSVFFERWKFHHPTPQDFFEVVDEVSGQDLSWFFEQTYNSANVFDYAVESVRSEIVRTPRGYVEQEGDLVFQNAEPKNGVGNDSAKAETQYRSTVILRRWGEAIFPLEVKVRFEDGEEILEHWDGKNRWTQFEYLQPAKIASVEADPERKLVLDVNYTNNSWTHKPEAAAAARKWASKWMIWLQSVLEFFAFFS
jgi:hypothetical protein